MKLPAQLIQLLAGGALLATTGCPASEGQGPSQPEPVPSVEPSQPEPVPAVEPSQPEPVSAPAPAPLSASSEPVEPCEEPPTTLEAKTPEAPHDPCPGCGRG